MKTSESDCTQPVTNPAGSQSAPNLKPPDSIPDTSAPLRRSTRLRRPPGVVQRLYLGRTLVHQTPKDNVVVAFIVFCSEGKNTHCVSDSL